MLLNSASREGKESVWLSDMRPKGDRSGMAVVTDGTHRLISRKEGGE